MRPAALGRVSRQVRANVGSEGHLNGRLKPDLTGDVVQRLASNVVGEFDGFIRGARVTVDGVTSDIWFRGAYRGNFFAAAGFTSQSTDGLADLGTHAVSAPAPAPAAKVAHVRLDKGWYFYHQLANALAGNFDRNQLLGAGTYRVVNRDSRGPIQVDSPRGRVWLGTRNTQPPVVHI